MLLLWQKVQSRRKGNELFLWWIPLHDRDDLHAKNKSSIDAATPTEQTNITQYTQM